MTTYGYADSMQVATQQGMDARERLSLDWQAVRIQVTYNLAYGRWDWLLVERTK